MESQIADISHAIQLAVAPVFLLTALATLINVMNGRLSRIVDRRRVVQARFGEAPNEAGASSGVQDELALLDRRSSLIYFSIFFAVLSALLVCLVVAGAFLGALMTTDASKVVATLFVLAMLATIVCLSLFLREIFLAVRAGGHRRA
jgi:hypothetical protein